MRDFLKINTKYPLLFPGVILFSAIAISSYILFFSDSVSVGRLWFAHTFSSPTIYHIPPYDQKLSSNEEGQVDNECPPKYSSQNEERTYTVCPEAVYYSRDQIPDADIATFQILKNDWAKDKNHNYFLGYPLPDFVDVVPETHNPFMFLSHEEASLIENLSPDGSRYLLGACFPEPGGMSSSNGPLYYKGNRYLFVFSTVFQRSVIFDLDDDSFRFLGYYYSPYEKIYDGSYMPENSFYSKDKNAVYYSCGEILEGADPETFVHLGDGYGKDKNQIWYANKTIERADVASFVLLDNFYAKDKNRVYYEGNPLLESDSSSFVLLEDFLYAKDNENVYFAGFLLKEADIDTFMVIKTPPDMDFWPSKSYLFSKDKNRVYYKGRVLEGVDPISCTAETIPCFPPGWADG